MREDYTDGVRDSKQRMLGTCLMPGLHRDETRLERPEAND